jgi:hypothetical protein
VRCSLTAVRPDRALFCSGQSKRFTSAHRRPFPDDAIQVRASIDASPVRPCLTGEGWNGIDDAAVFDVAGAAVQSATFLITDIVIPARGSGVARDGNPPSNGPRRRSPKQSARPYPSPRLILRPTMGRGTDGASIGDGQTSALARIPNPRAIDLASVRPCRTQPSAVIADGGGGFACGHQDGVPDWGERRRVGQIERGQFFYRHAIP